MVLPGGFSYGDYLRCGAIARFAPVMDALVAAARGGLPVLGICNGFQILCESHLLPGALIRNDHRKFDCLDQRLASRTPRPPGPPTSRPARRSRSSSRTARAASSPTRRPSTGSRARAGWSSATSADNPNGSYRDIAGITNERGNVVGLMPHPEHAVEEGYGPSPDGLGFFTSIIKQTLESAATA